MDGIVFLEASGVMGDGCGVSGGMNYSQRFLKGREVGGAGSRWRWVPGGIECYG